MTLKCLEKFDVKLPCGLDNDEEFCNFHQNTWKCQN